MACLHGSLSVPHFSKPSIHPLHHPLFHSLKGSPHIHHHGMKLRALIDSGQVLTKPQAGSRCFHVVGHLVEIGLWWERRLLLVLLLLGLELHVGHGL